jgi:OOP family OmpA-OmpF porin
MYKDTVAAIARAGGMFLLAMLIGCGTPEVPAPETAPQPEPAAAPAAPPPAETARIAPKPIPVPKPAPSVRTVISTQLFDYKRSTLGSEAQAQLDREIVARLKDFSSVDVVIVNGHTDRIGPTPYNQALSERRAEAVRAYLVSRGIDRSKIETHGFGSTMPVKSCPEQKNQSALIACLAPNRRVEVEVKGVPK